MVTVNELIKKYELRNSCEDLDYPETHYILKNAIFQNIDRNFNQQAITCWFSHIYSIFKNINYEVLCSWKLAIRDNFDYFEFNDDAYYSNFRLKIREDKRFNVEEATREIENIIGSIKCQKFRDFIKSEKSDEDKLIDKEDEGKDCYIFHFRNGWVFTSEYDNFVEFYPDEGKIKVRDFFGTTKVTEKIFKIFHSWKDFFSYLNTEYIDEEN